jgi:hypothetical protein
MVIHRVLRSSATAAAAARGSVPLSAMRSGSDMAHLQ